VCGWAHVDITGCKTGLYVSRHPCCALCWCPQSIHIHAFTFLCLQACVNNTRRHSYRERWSCEWLTTWHFIYIGVLGLRCRCLERRLLQRELCDVSAIGRWARRRGNAPGPWARQPRSVTTDGGLTSAATRRSLGARRPLGRSDDVIRLHGHSGHRAVFMWGRRDSLTWSLTPQNLLKRTVIFRAINVRNYLIMHLIQVII